MKTLVTIFTFICIGLSAGAQTIEADKQHIDEPIEVVKEFLTAYMIGDHQTFTELIHPDVIWIQPGDNRISGIKRSKSELLQMGAKMSEISARTLRLTDVKYFAAHGNTVVCILHWNAAQPSGVVLDIDNVDMYTVENGKIIMAKIFSEEIAEENAFWGK